MQDGNTATISPVPSEDEMNKLRQWFDNGLNAIVQATELAKVVESLKVEVEGMRHEIATVRDNNRWLDEQLSNVRTQRDQAKTELEQVNSELVQVKSQKSYAEEQCVRTQTELAYVQDQLIQVRKDRDEAQFNALAVVEKLDEANAKLASIKASLGLVDAPSSPSAPSQVPASLPAPSMVEAPPEPQPYNPDPPKHYWER